MIDYYMIFCQNRVTEYVSSSGYGLQVRSDLRYGNDEHIKLAIL